MARYQISKHALNRTIERLVLSQNIRLNKKQVSKNRKRAQNIIGNDIKNHFAEMISPCKRFIYLYAGLEKGNICKKYVINRTEQIIVTVIDNIKLNEEIEKHYLVLKQKKLNITKKETIVTKKEDFFISNYIYAIMNNNKYLFVVGHKNKKIYSLSCLKECKKC